jgi:hypothetical protein
MREKNGIGISKRRGGKGWKGEENGDILPKRGAR